MAETELQRAEQRYAQAKARLQALKNREATRERKLDTRRKVILGGALLDLAHRDSNAAAMVDRLIRNLPRAQDSKAFDDWQLTPAADGSGTGATSDRRGDSSAAGGDHRTAVDATSAASSAASGDGASAQSAASVSDTGTDRSGQ